MTRRLASDPTEIARARRLVRAHLQAWGLAAEIAPLELAVSEMVTNAIVHGRGVVDLRLAVDQGRITVEVTDDGRGTVDGRGADNHAVGGWGLRLVDELADDWGLGQVGDRTRVWMTRRTGGRGHGSAADAG